MLSFSLGKWSASLRNGMTGWFSLFNFFRNLNCAPIHILISSELNIQFLYNLANIQAAPWKAGMLFFLSLPPKGYASSCAPPPNCDKQWWYSKLPVTLPCSQWHPNQADPVSAPNEVRQSHPQAALHKAGKLHAYSVFLLPPPPRRSCKLGYVSQHWALLA